jgi:predicted NUDIX family phosphoesterase
LISALSNPEIDFAEVMETHIEKLGLLNQDRIQIERVRVLLSLLYLIQESRVEAWEEEESFNIYIKLLECPKPQVAVEKSQ